MGLLGEVPGMIAFLFTADDALVIEDDARKTLGDRSAEVLDAALLALEAREPWDTASLEEVLRETLV